MKPITNWDLETTFNKKYKAPEDKIELQNQFIYIRIDKDWVFVKDKTDIQNEESAFTKSKRNIEKCKKLIKDNYYACKFQDIIVLFEFCKVKYHRYCAID